MAGLYLTIRLIYALPVFGAALFVIGEPSYFKLMFEQATGIIVLLLAGGLVAVGIFLSELAIRLLKRRRIVVGIVLEAISLLACSFPSLWIFLLGPAVVVLMNQSTG